MPHKKATVVSVVGARPQFVKLAALAPRLKRTCHHLIVHTGQHYDYNMSDAFFAQLKIPAPDINLNIGSGNHGLQTGRILEACEKTLMVQKPDMVLVYGDTNTTLAGALAATKLGVPVGHIEAGLRSFRRHMPEEINRVAADHMSDLLFYPTPTARRNLRNEGIRRGLVRSGDLMYEILDGCLDAVDKRKTVIAEHGLDEGQYILVTLHRAENSDDPKRLERFVDIMRQLPGDKLFPVHPRTVKNLKRCGLYQSLKSAAGMIMVPPQPYLETLALMAGARFIMTDSGGMQKEAYFLGRPCLTLRPETEWVETVEAGANFLVDLSITRIRRVLSRNPRPRARLKYTIAGKKPSAVIDDAINRFLRAG